MGNYKYKFSIITAVYNAEPFLKDLFKSIKGQSIGFKNIQLIMVDDGSTDASGKICDEFAKKHPDNITVIHKENGGVSSARNLGLELAEGKYINFIDSDDKWKLNAFKAVWKFFEAHYDDVDVVSVPLVFFEGRKGDHILNYKFENGTRVVDLNEEWDAIQMSAATCFFKNDAIKGITFDTNLSYAEDSKVVQQVLIKKQKLGLVANTAYMYRSRATGEASAMQKTVQSKNWYLPVMEYYHLPVIEMAVKQLGYVPKYLQMILMYDLQWRIKIPALKDKAFLSEDDIKRYKGHVKTVLDYIDEDIILAQRHIFRDHKLYALQTKYGKKPGFSFDEEEKYCYSYSDEAAFPLDDVSAQVEFLELENNKLSIFANLALYDLPYENVDFYFLINDKRVDCKDVIDRGAITLLDDVVAPKRGIRAVIDINPKKTNVIKICANINGQEILFKRLQFGLFAPLSNKYNRSYYIKENKIITYHCDSLIIRRNNIVKALVRELKVFLQIFKRDGKNGVFAALIREMLFVYKFFKRKPIWIVSDRAASGGDNGEAFFRYLRQNHKQIDTRFVLAKGSEDIEEISKVGPVLELDSFKHKILSAVSEYMVSSHAENEVFNPLRSRVEPFKSFWYKSKFVFLQHGVIKTDLSDWLKFYNKDIFGFITSAKGERDSILNYNYSYGEDRVWLTGLPRFDRLYNDEKKLISIMPTWRKYLTLGWDQRKNDWNIIPNFEESEYYKFYNALICNEKLLNAAKEYGYSFEFIMHPNLRSVADKFKGNDLVKIVTGDVKYKDIYAHSDLIVSDYSSAVFDFAYLRKPIIYSQFDADEFFSGKHTSSDGYFEDKRDGFGEVEQTLEGTVDRIIEYMENGCELKDFYRERIDNFFAFDDKNNCKRVYEKMIEARKYK